MSAGDRLTKRTQRLKQSGIRAASQRCAELSGINLGQGVCDIPMEQTIKQAACDAIQGNKNSYCSHLGLHHLREQIAKKCKRFNHIDVKPDHEVMVTDGASGAFVAATHALFEAGDEVVLFEPFYGYHKSILELHGVVVRALSIDLATLTYDFDQLKKLVTSRTKAIVITTPNNPTGKVFSKEELLAIGELARENDLTVITDEIYEYFTYPGYEHVSLASLEDHFQRTITISGFSKTYNMTGWRLGYATGPRELIQKMALVHDLLYICAPTPLQYGVETALQLPASYFHQMREAFLEKRDFMVESLTDLGFKVTIPQGAYYLMADCTALGFDDDADAANFLLEEAKVATVPGRAFYLKPGDGKQVLRFCFALNKEKLEKAFEQMSSALVEV